MQTEWIIVSEYCHKCQIEPSFIDLLQEEGLIEIRTEGDEHYLLVSQLPEVERYSRMYYDLSINMEGIDAIHHLLERMEGMRREMNSLRNQLLVYRKHELEETEWWKETGKAEWDYLFNMKNARLVDETGHFYIG